MNIKYEKRNNCCNFYTIVHVIENLYGTQIHIGRLGYNTDIFYFAYIHPLGKSN